MSQTNVICVFSLFKKDPTFKSAVSINTPINWLNGKNNQPHRYYFRTVAPSNLTIGSKVLFSFENQIFGEALIKSGVQDLTEPDKQNPETFSDYYKKFVTLDPNSIKIYRFHPTKSELMECEIFEGYQFSQLYSYLTLEQYTEILRRAMR
jgi:CRISPR/Cas system CMR-associated protein Cmr1 (group 7 of RAMP superfamily)